MRAPLQCVVLAGGLGTRMRPLTDALPKNMLPVAGRPFALWQLGLLASQGVEHFVYVIGHRGEAIRDYFGDGSRFGVRVSYVDEGRTLRGTGGALRFALDHAPLDPAFLLIYGDSFTPVPIAQVQDAFAASGMPALMTVLCNSERWDRSNVLFEDGRIVIYDKTRRHPRSLGMRHIDYGLSVLRREMIRERIPEGEAWDLSTTFHQLSVEGRLAGFEAQERFYEIGSPAGLQDFEAYAAKH